jgi:hypothetical protein
MIAPTRIDYANLDASVVGAELMSVANDDNVIASKSLGTITSVEATTDPVATVITVNDGTTQYGIGNTGYIEVV